MVDTVVGQSVAPAAGRVEAWLLPEPLRRIHTGGGGGGGAGTTVPELSDGCTAGSSR